MIRISDLRGLGSVTILGFSTCQHEDSQVLAAPYDVHECVGIWHHVWLESIVYAQVMHADLSTTLAGSTRQPFEANEGKPPTLALNRAHESSSLASKMIRERGRYFEY